MIEFLKRLFKRTIGEYTEIIYEEYINESVKESVPHERYSLNFMELEDMNKFRTGDNVYIYCNRLYRKGDRDNFLETRKLRNGNIKYYKTY